MAPTEDELLAGIHEWVRIESHTADPAGVNRLMDNVEARYRTLGADIERIAGVDGYGDHLSIRAPWKTQGKYILVLSHLDTVHPKGTIDGDLPVRVEGEKAFGPGIYDMKGGAFLGYSAVKSLIEEGIETDLGIRILYTADEEVGSPTSRALIEEAAKDAAHVLVTEPARNGGRVVTSRKGVARFVMTAKGQPAHSGSRHADGRSAIKEIAHQIIALEDMTDYERGITINVGQVRGGTGTNVVPGDAVAHIDLRVPSAEAGEEMVAKVLGLTPHDPDVKLTIVGGMNRPPFERLPGTAALFDHARELAAQFGLDLKDTFTGGGSDGNFTATIAPTLDALGVDGDGAHTLHEHLYVSSLVPRYRLLRRLMETLR
ncbi:MAG: M20 family metallopeptidase [Pseudomonadota bacterium]